MDRQLANTVVDCLQATGGEPDIDRLRGFTERDWRLTLPWLDRTGITLYLLRRLESLGATDSLPPSILHRIGNNLEQNRRRLDRIANQFATINDGFYRNGVNFAVIKGFSLVPEFCPDASLRTPCDLDYLVDKQSLLLARRVLEEAGYCLERLTDLALTFGFPSPRIPARSDDPYSPETEPLIELHLAFWDHYATGISLPEPGFRLDQAVNHEWRGLRFPALNEEDAFVLQIIHIFQHIVNGWVKSCWLLELGYFMDARSSDSEFWDRVDVRMHEVPLLTEFGAVVTGLARRAFDVTVPSTPAQWAQNLTPAAKLWLGRYGRTFVMEDYSYVSFRLFDSTKFCIFLQWEFMSDRRARQEMTWRRLFPWKAPKRVAALGDKSPMSSLAAIRLQSQFVIRRLIFHLASDLRFLWEFSRWREVNRRAKATADRTRESLSRGS